MLCTSHLQNDTIKASSAVFPFIQQLISPVQSLYAFYASSVNDNKETVIMEIYGDIFLKRVG